MREKGMGAAAIAVAIVVVVVGAGLGIYVLTTILGGGGGNTMVMTHGGVDFSAGVGNCEAENIPYADHDGDIIWWSPFYQDSQYTGLWFRPAYDENYQLYQFNDMGAVSLGSVTNVPASGDTGDIAPLTVGYTYVVRCKDGYVKFHVTAINTEDKHVTVQYIFSTTTNF